MDDTETVRTHYGMPSLMESVTQALSVAGFDDRQLSWEDLTPLDQLHVRGLAATRELAAELNVPAGATVLDIGCGIGGASRFLTATYGARVTGVDLTPEFIEIARMLSERAGLSDRVSYRVADATRLPFDDASFDYAWTQHVAMNIRDRDRLYAEVFRVLEPGGSFAIYDVVRGDGDPLIFPVPWAREPDTSFLLTPDAMRQVLVHTGFEVVSWSDTTVMANEWLARQGGAPSRTSLSPAIGIHLVTPPDFAVMIANLGRNLTEGRARLLQAIVRRPE